MTTEKESVTVDYEVVKGKGIVITGIKVPMWHLFVLLLKSSIALIPVYLITAFVLATSYSAIEYFRVNF